MLNKFSSPGWIIQYDIFLGCDSSLQLPRGGTEAHSVEERSHSQQVLLHVQDDPFWLCGSASGHQQGDNGDGDDDDNDDDDNDQTAVLYHPAPNPQLHDPKTGDPVSLLSVSPSGTAEEPLVINFGSCTWPPFMVNLARVKQIQERFDRATYLTVYTRGELGNEKKISVKMSDF